MDNDQMFGVVCYRVADREPDVQSSVDACDQCDVAVWLADSSPPCDLVLCTRCAEEITEVRKKAGLPTEIAPPTPAQLRELADML
jgi:hypothetical protein